MRIVYVTAHLPFGTDEAFIVPEILQLMRLGHEVMVVPRSRANTAVHGAALMRSSRVEGLLSPQVLLGAATRLHKLPNVSSMLRHSRSIAIMAKNLAVVPKAAWLAEFARQWDADHMHCHWAGTTATMTMLASALSAIPWSFTAHRWDIVENNLLKQKVVTASMARFISNDGLAMARAIGIPDAEHVRVIPMGVNIPERPATPGASRLIVLCPARLVEVKGHQHLLHAWKILLDRGIRAELWLAGDGELKPELERLTTHLGIQQFVRFLGLVPHSRLLQLYSEIGISATALASVDMGAGCHEGIPVALMEAMSYGVPVIATATGGTPELIEWGTGLLVPPKNPQVLADALYSLLRDTNRIVRLGTYGRRHVMTKFDITQIAKELESGFSAARTVRAARAAA